MLALPSLFRRKARNLVADRSGNVALVLAFAALPLMLIAGLGVDYFRDLSLKARLDEASDAAAIAAANTALAYVKANAATEADPQLSQDAIDAGKAQAARVFQANVGVAKDEVAGAVASTVTLVTASADENGQRVNSFQATVSYQANLNAGFGPLVGINQLPLDGTASASAKFPGYMDLYFLIDGSGSMGIGATETDQSAMQAAIGCTVACHSPWNGQGRFWPQGTYPNVRAINFPNPVTLRIDVVRQAVINELKIIQASAFPGQFRVAIYEFSNDLRPVYPLSSDIGGAIKAAENIDIIGAAGEGGTYATYSLGQFNKTLPAPGDGSSANSRLGSVLLFTDGIQDDATPQADGSEIDSCKYAANYTPFGQASPCDWKIQGFNSADCDGIKSQKYTLYTLDFIYYVSPAAAATDARYQFIGGTLNPAVQANMQACATTPQQATYASTPTEFDNALSALVNQVLANVQLTN